MAAAVIAVVKQDGVGNGLERLPTSQNLGLGQRVGTIGHARGNGPDEQRDCIKSEVIEKLRADSTWSQRLMILTRTQLSFAMLTDDEEATPLDWIPLHEIAAIKPWSPSSIKARLDTPVRQHVPGQDGLAFEIYTVEGGYNSGRTYCVQVADHDSGEDWIGRLRDMSVKQRQIVKKQTKLENWKEWARNIYKGGYAQSVVVVLITGNFAMNIVQAQLNPESDSQLYDLFEVLDWLFMVVFAIELAFNAFGHWFWAFVSDGWSMFDLVVVTLSILAKPVDGLPGVSILRTMRAFRILRLIGRFKKLKQITNAIISSIIPVMNAFLIGLMVTLIYAIIGVSLYSERSPENFGTFARALFSLFLLMAFDKWTEDLPGFDAEGKVDFGVVIFMFSFVIIVIWTLVQVVVAVLLDNFIAATLAEKQTRALERQKKNRAVTHALDPLLDSLCGTYDCTTDLSKRIFQVFLICDSEDQGYLTFDLMREGFRKLDLKPQVHLSREDYDSITEGFLEHAEGHVHVELFQKIFRRQINLYVQRTVADAVAMANAGPETAAILSALKLILLSDETKAHNPSSQALAGLARIGSTASVSSEPGGMSVLSGIDRKRVDEVEGEVKRLQGEMRDGFGQLNSQMRTLAKLLGADVESFPGNGNIEGNGNGSSIGNGGTPLLPGPSKADSYPERSPMSSAPSNYSSLVGQVRGQARMLPDAVGGEKKPQQNGGMPGGMPVEEEEEEEGRDSLDIVVPFWLERAAVVDTVTGSA